MPFISRGRICGSEIGTIADGMNYRIRIEATERAAALLFALGIEFRYVGPEQDSGRAWYEFEYDSRFDVTLKEIVDVVGDLVYNQPGFGQLMLFDEEENE